MKIDSKMPIIFGRNFLATMKAIINVSLGMITIRMGEEWKHVRVFESEDEERGCYADDEKEDIFLDDPEDERRALENLTPSRSCEVKAITSWWQALPSPRNLDIKSREVVNFQHVCKMKDGRTHLHNK